MKRKILISLLLVCAMLMGAVTAFAEEAPAQEAGAYYDEAAAWAAERGILPDENAFAPDGTVTRAEAVAFLWRMAGQPEPQQDETFADVAADADYAAAVRWAVEQGITNGTGGGNFSPDAICSRGMILTMLYRMEGRPFDAAAVAEIPENTEEWTLEDMSNYFIQSFINSFRTQEMLKDVAEGTFYEIPIYWAVTNSILDENTVDTEAMTIAPAAPCTQGEMMYCLYRTNAYEEAVAAAEEANRPPEPIHFGEVPETVLMDKDGVKVTLVGVELDRYGDSVMHITVENTSDKQIAVDGETFYVNTYAFYPYFYTPEVEGDITFYNDVTAAPGETVDGYADMSSLREAGILSVYEMEIQMTARIVTKVEDGYEYEPYADGEPVTIRTSLYDENDPPVYGVEGTVVVDQNGLQVVVCRAENSEYNGPQIAVYFYNGTDKDVYVELTGLKLDGVEYEGFCSASVAAGKRRIETVYVDYDYDNVPVAQQAELTFALIDTETWEPAQSFAPVTVPFAN